MEWPWPPHLLADSSFSKEIRDASILHHWFSLYWEQKVIWFSAGADLTHPRKRDPFSLHSLRPRFAKCHPSSWRVIWLKVHISVDRKKKLLILMELEYFWFLVFILPSKQKTSLILPHAHSGTNATMPNASQLSTHTHWFPQTLSPHISRRKSKRTGSEYTLASKQCKEKQTRKTLDWLNHVYFYYGERTKNTARVLVCKCKSQARPLLLPHTP